MFRLASAAGTRTRVLITRWLERLGFRDESFLLLPAEFIGIVTAFAAVGFHELTQKIEQLLYDRVSSRSLYSSLLPLLILFPAFGGLAVGVISRYIARSREGHGITDVIESVIRTRGFVRPGLAIEKIVTSAITIGTGGSAGAEGPIVQIGAAIASGIGSLFGLASFQMPVLVGCGSAAGISAIFNSPIGGVLFTLEVILQDFSIRTFTPLVVASVVANVTTRGIFNAFNSGGYRAIFAMPSGDVGSTADLLVHWRQMPNFVLLGLICGGVGVSLTRLMNRSEVFLNRFNKLGAAKPAFGGAIVGVLGVIYVLLFGRWMLNLPKPFPNYPMPAFFSDGYDVIHQLLGQPFYSQFHFWPLVVLLIALCVLKLLATCMTLASGGSGGVIAPSLFLGAVSGGLLGQLLHGLGWFAVITPQTYALVGMGATLAALVHAPMASILILFELTNDYRVTLPAMLATVTAVGTARFVFADSIYTHSLRKRGVRLGTTGQSAALQRVSVEQVIFEPASTVRFDEPVQRIFDLITQLGATSFVVVKPDGSYYGMVVTEETNLALAHREQTAYALVADFTRTDIPLVRNTETIASVMELFAQLGVAQLPVCLASMPTRAIGLLSRTELVRVSQQLMAS